MYLVATVCVCRDRRPRLRIILGTYVSAVAMQTAQLHPHKSSVATRNELQPRGVFSCANRSTQETWRASRITRRSPWLHRSFVWRLVAKGHGRASRSWGRMQGRGGLRIPIRRSSTGHHCLVQAFMKGRWIRQAQFLVCPVRCVRQPRLLGGGT